MVGLNEPSSETVGVTGVVVALVVVVVGMVVVVVGVT